MRTETEMAYLAGLLDGEGHIGISLTSPGKKGERWRTHYLTVTIAMSNLPVLEWLRATWSGAVLSPKKATGYPMWQLRWQSAAGAAVLRETLPYMRVKAAQATLAIQFADDLASRPHQAASITEAEWDRRESLRLAIQSLNRPGKDPYTPRLSFGAKAKEPITCKFCGKASTEYGTRKRQFCDKQCANAFFRAKYKADKQQA